jgi:hypothetical protein
MKGKILTNEKEKIKKGASYKKKLPINLFEFPFAGITQIRYYEYFSAISCEAPRFEKIFC